MFAYCYTVVAVSTVLLAKAVMRFTGIYRAQAAVMLFGVLLPWAVNIIDMKRMLGFIPVDLVSMTFAVTGLTFLPALYWFRLLDVIPLAWATVVKLMKDPVVVIDPWGRIVDLEPGGPADHRSSSPGNSRGRGRPGLRRLGCVRQSVGTDRRTTRGELRDRPHRA